MLDFNNLESYKENNRIEAKRASGGLPESIWETYSAFANTLGGVILLGVAEARDKSLSPIDLPDPEALAAEFWEKVNDKSIVSANILSKDDVDILSIDGKHIIAITVPPAPESLVPVFIGQDPYLGSYKRSGEGDYKFTRQEVEIMLSK